MSKLDGVFRGQSASSAGRSRIVEQTKPVGTSAGSASLLLKRCLKKRCAKKLVYAAPISRECGNEPVTSGPLLER